MEVITKGRNHPGKNAVASLPLEWVVKFNAISARFLSSFVPLFYRQHKIRGPSCQLQFITSNASPTEQLLGCLDRDGLGVGSPDGEVLYICVSIWTAAIARFPASGEPSGKK